MIDSKSYNRYQRLLGCLNRLGLVKANKTAVGTLVYRLSRSACMLQHIAELIGTSCVD
jgi:hypothetical protein